MYNGDNAFEMIRDKFGEANVNIVGREEHVGPAEREIRTIKERARCTTNYLPYKRFPIIMTRALIQSITDMLNIFPRKDSIAEDYSPAAIVLGKPSIDYNMLKLDFGSYCRVYDGTDNTNKSRSVGAIALQSSNEHGAYYFMSLESGKRIHATFNNWKELSIYDDVISRVEEIAEE